MHVTQKPQNATMLYILRGCDERSRPAITTEEDDMADSQLRKGALELVTLAVLDNEPSYGGQLLQRLSEQLQLAVSPGTLYPLLARLNRSGAVETNWQESPIGPPRKIYNLTPAGRARLGQLQREWQALTAAINAATQPTTPKTH